MNATESTGENHIYDYIDPHDLMDSSKHFTMTPCSAYSTTSRPHKLETVTARSAKETTIPAEYETVVFCTAKDGEDAKDRDREDAKEGEIGLETEVML